LDKGGLESFGILDQTEQKMHFIPKSVLPQIKTNSRQLVFHKVDYENGRIQGFGIVNDDTTSLTDDQSFGIWPAWSVDFGEEEEIIHVSVRDGAAKVADTL